MTSLTMSLALDLLGTFVFALSGAMLAVRRSLDVFGVLVLALAAGLAGGLIRDIILGQTPPAAFASTRYLMTALAAGVMVFFFHKVIERINRPVMLLDALGLGLFAVTGCNKALAYGLDPLPAIILGILTAVGGGVVRDLLVTEIPRVLREEIYAFAALSGGVIVVLGRAFALPEVHVAITAILLTFVVRVVSVWRGWQAPHAPGS